MGIRGLIILEPHPALGSHVTSVRADLHQKPLWVGEEIDQRGYNKVSRSIQFVCECDSRCHCRVNVCGGQCCVGWSKTPGSQRCTKRELWRFFWIMHVLGFSQVFLLHYTTLELKSKILLEQGMSYNHSESLVKKGLFSLIYRWFAKDWGFHMKMIEFVLLERV